MIGSIPARGTDRRGCLRHWQNRERDEIAARVAGRLTGRAVPQRRRERPRTKRQGRGRESRNIRFGGDRPRARRPARSVEPGKLADCAVAPRPSSRVRPHAVLREGSSPGPPWGRENESIPTQQPVMHRPMWGRYGRVPARNARGSFRIPAPIPPPPHSAHQPPPTTFPPPLPL